MKGHDAHKGKLNGGEDSMSRTQAMIVLGAAMIVAAVATALWGVVWALGVAGLVPAVAGWVGLVREEGAANRKRVPW